MKIEQWKLSDIKPYPGNPRQNDAAVDAVAESIREFGFRQPIVVDAEGVIICGHTRYKAALKLGLEKVPVHVATDLTPAQIKAYRIADNKTADLADVGLRPAADRAVGPPGHGLRPGPARLLAGRAGEDARPGREGGLDRPRRVPEPPDEAITQPGDLWILGDHRLLCGDSSKPEDVDRLLAGATIQLVNTDPPYNVKVEPRSNNAIAAGTVRSPTTITSSWTWPGIPEKSKPTHQQDAGEGPAAGQRLRVGRAIRPDAHRLVRQHGPRAGARPRVLHLGRLCQLRQLPAGAEGHEALLLPGDHLGQGASGADAQGLHGGP